MTNRFRKSILSKRHNIYHFNHENNNYGIFHTLNNGKTYYNTIDVDLLTMIIEKI
jgi:hypothetical protein